MNKQKFERDIQLSLLGHNWIIGIIYDSFDTRHEFDIQSISMVYDLSKVSPRLGWALEVCDVSGMLESSPDLMQQFECAVIAKLEEERQNV